LDFFHTITLEGAKINFVQLLEEIASEQEFEVIYIDMEEKATTGISAGVTSWGLLVYNYILMCVTFLLFVTIIFIVPDQYQFHISDQPTQNGGT
jgi:hypothetical protein